jgi:hypothetical protein
MLGLLRNTWAESRNFGVRNGLHSLAYRVLNRCADYRVLQGMKITRVDPAYLSGGGHYTYGFLDAAQLARFARDPQYDMTPAFVAQAAAKGDECYAILDGDVLASYGWYSNAPTHISDDLVLHFSRDYVYMYKGYTHPKYRGQRLHAIGMTRALDAYLRRGFHGLISYVETNNYSSLKSVYRMGYEDVGRIYVGRVLGSYRAWHTPGCHAYGFFLKPAGRVVAVPGSVSELTVPAEVQPECRNPVAV